MGSEGFGPEIYEIAGYQISETVMVTWLIMAVLITFFFFATRKLTTVPSKFQAAIEVLVDGINTLVKQTMGEKNKKFAPYIGTLLLFIATSNLAGLVGLRPPTADANTTIGLSMMTFVSIHAFGIRSKGLGYFKGFLEPFPLLLPLNIIGELATPISLGFRLFGNIVGGMIIMSLLYGALGWFAVLPIPAVLHIYFDLFAGILQSFIFCMLTMVFISMAID